MLDPQQPPLEIWSLGAMSAQLRWPVSRVLGTLNGLKFRPTLTINDVGHYGTDAYLELMRIAHAEGKAAAAEGSPHG